MSRSPPMLRALLAILALHRVALGIAAALIIVYALAGFFWVPHLLRVNAQKYVSDELGRGLALGDVAFNPFTFRLSIRNATLSEKAGEPIASFGSLVVNAELASIWQRAVVLKEVQLDAPDVNLVVERDGSINLAHLAPPQAEPAAATNEPAAPLPRIRIGRLAVNGGRVDFLDRTRPEPFTATLAPIHFALTDFRTDLNHENAYDFAAQSAAGETVNWSGRFTAQPLGSDGQFRIGQLRAQTIDDYLQGQLPVRLADGKLSFAGTYKLSLQPTLSLDVGLPEIALDNFALAERAAADSPPLAVIPKVRVLGTRFAIANRSLRVDKIEVNDARVRAAREADGSLSVQRLTKSNAQPAPAEPAPATNETAPAPAPWQWAVGEIRVANATADLEDHAVSPTVQLTVTPIALTVAGLSSAQGAKVNLSADLGLNGASVCKTTGELQLAPLTAALALDLNAFDLAILQPYVAQATNLTLRSGRLSLKGAVSAAMEEGASPRLQFRGDVQVADLHTIAGPANDDLVKWRNLAVTGIDVSHNPDRLTIDRVVARQPYARVIIAHDRTLNVTAALKRETGDTTEPAEQAPPPAKSPPTPVRIKSVAITGGSALFADNSITPSFASGIVDLEGTVTGLSSQPDSRAKVKLAGKVDRYAPVDITGEVNLLAAAKYSDVALNFRNMELTTFNPYSGKFAGYNISKGKLSTELRYKVQNRQLDAQHHIVVDNLEFGDKTDSKDAAPIPIKLAVALLKDRQGVIDLQLPVGGSLDDPKFRLGPIIWKALLGLLTKIVTAPFAALGSLFGGGEELAYVDFQPGSADLPMNKIEQLGKLSQALVDRPQLRLDVPVTLIAEQDGKAIAAASLYARVPKLADAADDAALKKRLAQLEALYKQSTKIAPDYPAQTKTESGIDLNARTEWLEARLLEGMQPDQSALETLGRQRAQAVQAAILANTDVAPERVFITTDRSAALTNDVGVRMEMKLE
ncbi:MAG TPA: DUF748 domain-containing protein [Steroidobacteraceae bacterium]|nr:DUF748 domain-containing protein [Steroidobacteraceae bacterium]